MLIGLVTGGETRIQVEEQMEELALLADTAGADVLDSIVQVRRDIDPATYFGKGKIDEIINQAIALSCSLVIFNDEVNPNQLKNVQKIAGEDLKVIDRTNLILDIFNQHAQTREAKTQVELAQLQYLLPRLTRMWTHLERQMKGIGTRGGPGETQIEIDRRLISKQITKLKSDLKKIEKQRYTRISHRNHEYQVALVGYTNAGKSTLMKALTGADVLIEDKLFATLDTTTRQFDIKKGLKVLLSDTVGFIHKLPHDLVASFKSTLREAADANLLLKVVDASSPQWLQHLTTIHDVLKSIELEKITSLLVFNKIDRISDPSVIMEIKTKYPDAIFISALNKLKFDNLQDNIIKIIEQEYVHKILEIPYAKSGIMDIVYSHLIVNECKHLDEYIRMDVQGSKGALSTVIAKLKE